ncbi:MAG: metallophosphoesterase [Fulvivirga sp.]|nr:metallophosphoesterase [Fulvivirga sp.]
MRKFVMGDIHGAYKALKQCLERSGFDYDQDELIFLGDVCDGWPETNQSIEELLKIKKLTFVLGNHDHWALQWGKDGIKSHIWLSQGGRNTVNSYGNEGMPTEHVEFLEKAQSYHLQGEALFVHAGIDPDLPLDKQDDEIFLWDRALVKKAIENKMHGTENTLTDFEAVYVGHTPVHGYGFLEPVRSGDIWLMDTGAGWDGVLSMMDLESQEVFTSDKVNTLYPAGSGRM